ncbi:MAG: hypothetical protein NVS2B12_01830 [Ktedonobacteraceae bacterium]
MQQKLTQAGREKSFLSFYFRYGSIFLLLVLSVLLVACSAGANTNTNGDNTLNTGSTAAIHLGANSSPTPSLAPYWCGAWITRSTVPYDPKGVIALYAKYTRNVDGNPIGVAGAQVQALIQWGDGTPPFPMVQTTTSDGLAVFFVPIGDRSAAINKLSLATFTFTAPGASQCEVDGKRPASFVIVPASAAATPTPTDTNNGNGGNNGTHRKHH